jgi:hypothetical protein
MAIRPRGGLSGLSIFNRNKILSVYFGAIVVTQNTLSFLRITRALRKVTTLSIFREDKYSQYLIVVQ